MLSVRNTQSSRSWKHRLILAAMPHTQLHSIHITRRCRELSRSIIPAAGQKHFISAECTVINRQDVPRRPVIVGVFQTSKDGGRFLWGREDKGKQRAVIYCRPASTMSIVTRRFVVWLARSPSRPFFYWFGKSFISLPQFCYPRETAFQKPKPISQDLPQILHTLLKQTINLPLIQWVTF